MGARVKDLLQDENPIRPPTGEPDRSQVAPVSHDSRESGDDFSLTIKKLLAGLEPKITSEAIARSETLGKLPAAQQTLLRCALSATSETFKKVAIVQEELAGFKERQKRAETDLLAESQAISKRSTLAEAEVAGLRQDLAASVAANYARESRYGKQRRNLWMALGGTVSTGMVCAFLLFSRPVPSPASAGLIRIQPYSSDSEGIAHRSAEPTLVPPEKEQQPKLGISGTPSIPAQPATAARTGRATANQTLDRLNWALARVPPMEVDSVLGKANQWLMASRTAPCFVRFGEGEVSLLVSVKSRDAAPLRTAIARCTEAVEHVAE